MLTPEPPPIKGTKEKETPDELKEKILNLFGGEETVCYMYFQADPKVHLSVKGAGLLEQYLHDSLGQNITRENENYSILPGYEIKIWEGKIGSFPPGGLDPAKALTLLGQTYLKVFPKSIDFRTLYIRGNNKFHQRADFNDAVWIEYNNKTKELKIHQGGDEPDKPTLIIQVEKAGQLTHRYIIMDTSKSEKFFFAESLIRGKTEGDKVTIKVDPTLSARLSKIKLKNGTELGPQLKSLSYLVKGQTYYFQGMTGIDASFSPTFADEEFKAKAALDYKDKLVQLKEADKNRWDDRVKLLFSGRRPTSEPKGMKWVITYEFSVPPDLMYAKSLQFEGFGGLLLKGYAGIYGEFDPDGTTIYRRGGERPKQNKLLLTINEKQMKGLKGKPVVIRFASSISAKTTPEELKKKFDRLKPSQLSQVVVPWEMKVLATRMGEYDPAAYGADIKNAHANVRKIQNKKRELAKEAARADTFSCIPFEFTVRK